jgi:hypothetical protein
LPEDLTDAGLAAVTLETARDTYFVGEPFEVRLAFELEREFLETRLVPLFQRTLDVPVQITSPFLELEGLRALETREAATGAAFVLGEAVRRATPLPAREEEGRTMLGFEWRARVVATRVGELTLSAPSLHLAYATRFEDDFLQGRRAVDRRDGRVRGKARKLTIVPLPEEGRPADFSGAIGSFSIAARLASDALEVGGSLALTLELSAADPTTPLDFEPPHLDDLAGFRVTAHRTERAAGKLATHYDLVALAEAREFPSVAFSFFDLTPPAGYRTLTTQPLPLLVRPAPADSGPDGGAPDETAGDTGRAPLYGALLAFVVVAVVLVLRARRAR